MAFATRHQVSSALGRSASARPAAVRVAGSRGSLHKRFGRRSPVSVAAAQTDTQEAAESRWENQVKTGMVSSVSGKEAAELQKQGWVILDVRAPGEVKKVPITGAVEVPLFMEATDNDIGTWLAKYAHFGTGGWWLGGTHMIANKNFLQEVQAKIPKDAKIVVACQKGLRSLAACEQLSRAGYKENIAWVNGGCDTCRKGDLPTANGMDIRYAGIGGFSEVLGWTEVQQEEKKEKLGGAQGVLGVFAVILALDMLLFAYEYLQQQGVIQGPAV